jgi:hypothetical protein
LDINLEQEQEKCQEVRSSCFLWMEPASGSVYVFKISSPCIDRFSTQVYGNLAVLDFNEAKYRGVVTSWKISIVS